jgi:hypothetical protein
MRDPYEPVPQYVPITEDTKVGREVTAQAQNDSLGNTEPVALRQIISQIIGVVVTVLLFKGILEPQEGTIVVGQTEIIVGAVMSLAGIIGAIAGRQGAYSPRSAAEIAVSNAAKPSGAAPTLDPPP